MNINNKIVLITGGGSGIGFEIAKQLVEKGNKVIITGRNADKLKNATEKIGGDITYIPTDINSESDVDALVNEVNTKFGALDVLINNAGQAYMFEVDGGDAYDNAIHEFDTNFFSVIRLSDKLLPLLSKQPEAAIVNVTSVVSFIPSLPIPTYAASKAALRSYTISLRETLRKKNSPVKVFELLPPLVDTEFSAGIGGHNGIPPKQVADEFIAGFEKDEYEVRVGMTNDLYHLHLSSPQAAFEALNSREG